jgi:protein-tyrosine-phosphatase
MAIGNRMLSVVAYVQANPGCLMGEVCEWLNYKSKAHGYMVVKRAIREGLVYSEDVIVELDSSHRGKAVRLYPNSNVSVEVSDKLLNTNLISYKPTGLCIHGPQKKCKTFSSR